MFGSLIALAAASTMFVPASASAPLPIPAIPSLAIAGTPKTTAAPSAATLNLFERLAAASSAPTKSWVSVLWVGPPSKKSPSVSTSGVVAAISAAPNTATSVGSKLFDSMAFFAFKALAAFTANPPGAANCVINLAASPNPVWVSGVYLSKKLLSSSALASSDPVIASNASNGSVEIPSTAPTKPAPTPLMISPTAETSSGPSCAPLATKGLSFDQFAATRFATSISSVGTSILLPSGS